MDWFLFSVFAFLGICISVYVPMLAIGIKRLVAVVNDKQKLAVGLGSIFILIQLAFGAIFAVTGYGIMSFLSPFFGDRLAGFGTGIIVGSVLGMILLIGSRFGPKDSDNPIPAKAYMATLMFVSICSLVLAIVLWGINLVF